LQLEVTRALELNPMLELEEEVHAEAVVPPSCDVAPAEVAAVETAAFDELPESSMWDVAGASWNGEVDDRMQRMAEPGSRDPFVRVLQALALELDPPELEIAAFWLEHCDDAGYLDGDHAALLLRATARFDMAAHRIEAIRQRLLHGEPAGLAAREIGRASWRERVQSRVSEMP